MALASLSLGQCHFLFYSMFQALSPFSIFLENISILGKPASFDCLAYLSVLTPKVMMATVLFP